MELKYAVIGSGAIGGYYGGRLAHAGKEVSFLFHKDYAYVKDNGLTVDSVNGDFKVFPINAYQNSNDMPKADVILVCLKTTNNYLLEEILPPLLRKDSIVILVQNGLGMEEDLQKKFPKLQIAGGIAFIFSAKIGNGHIEHTDQGTLTIGSYSCADNSILDIVSKDFNEAGVNCNLINLEYARWKKLMWNIPFNGMSVVLNTTTDKLVKNKATRNLMHTLIIEVVRGANAMGKGKFIIDEAIAQKVLNATDKMIPYAPSMKQDFDRHQKLEIEYIYKRPIETVMMNGFEMKCTQMLAEQLEFIEDEMKN